MRTLILTAVVARADAVSVRFDPDRTIATRVAKAGIDAGFPATTRAHGD